MDFQQLTYHILCPVFLEIKNEIHSSLMDKYNVSLLVNILNVNMDVDYPSCDIF